MVQGDVKIIIRGGFTSYNGTTTNRIARLNTDGSLDTGFNIGTGTNNYIVALALQDDGKIIIGGSFIGYNGVGRNRIARINDLNALGIEDNTIPSNTLLVYKNKETLYIKNTNGTLQSVNIFNVTGKRVYFYKHVNNTVLEILNFNTVNQLLIIKVTDGNNGITTKKVVVE